MSQSEYEKEIARLINRAELLRQAKRGVLKLRRVPVRQYTVREHTVRAHHRLIAPLRGRVVTRQTGMAA